MSTCQAEPDGLRTRLVRTALVHVHAELGDHPHHLLQPRRSLGRHFVLHDAIYRLPLRRLEHDLATGIGTTAAQAAYVKRSPRDDQIQSDAVDQSRQGLETPFFNATPGLERAE